MKIKDVFGNKRWVIFVLGFILSNSIGVFIPMASIFMKDHGVKTGVIGAVASVYFVMLAMTSAVINKGTRQYNIKALVYLGFAISGGCALVFPYATTPLAWIVLMCFVGIGVGLYMIGIQTALQTMTEDALKGFTNGLYTLFFATGFAMGVVVGPLLYKIKAIWAFAYVSGLFLTAAITMALFLKQKIMIKAPPKGKSVIKKIKVALICVFAYGYLENTIASLYPVYLRDCSYSLDQVGYALGAFVVGGIVGTMPLVALSERIGRYKTLMISIVGILVALSSILYLDFFGFRLWWSFVAGLFIGVLYPISIVIANTGRKASEYVQATSALTVFYGFGSALGPFVSAFAMDQWGGGCIFLTSNVLMVLIIALLILKKNTRKKIFGKEVYSHEGSV